MTRPHWRAAFVVLFYSLLTNTPSSSRTCLPKTTSDLRDSQLLLYNGRCAVTFRRFFQWTEARDFCRQGSGELLKLSSQKDVDVLSTALNKECYWIGLNDRRTEGKFMWLDGTGTDLENMFLVKGPTIFDDETDCVKLCHGQKHNWIWLKQDCTRRNFFLCEFEMIEQTAYTTTSPARRIIDVVTSHLSSDFISTPSLLEGTTGRDTHVEAVFAHGQEKLEKRQTLFVKDDTLGRHSYLLAVQTQTVRSWSPTHCCSKCTAMEGCLTVNFNQKLRTCRLFTTREALQEGSMNVPGWNVYVSG